MSARAGSCRPGLFFIDLVEPMTLTELAATSISREQLQAEGYLSMMAHADLHRYGYTVRVWLKVKTMHTVYEYNPRLSELPRITADTYARQAALHMALGLNLVGKGETWTDYRQPGLFDAMLLEESLFDLAPFSADSHLEQ